MVKSHPQPEQNSNSNEIVYFLRTLTDDNRQFSEKQKNFHIVLKA